MRAKHFRNKALNMLRTNYWMLFLATLIVTLVLGSGAFTIIIFIILGGPLTVGLNLMYLKSYRKILLEWKQFFQSLIKILPIILQDIY